MANETALQVASDRPAPIARQSFEPTNLQEAIKFSEMIADSELAPPNFKGKPANVLVALQLGRELNVPPLQALQGIAVINQRAVIFGDLMWALVTTHPAFEDALEEITDTQAKVTLKRRGRSPVTVTFTQADAQKAGLWGKAGPWTQYPKRQMQWRARTFAARDLFPDALKGMISAEEAQDYPGETIEGQPATQAEPKQEPKEETIGQAGGSDFYKTYKASGWTPDEAKKWLSDVLQIGDPHNKKDSRDVPLKEWTAVPPSQRTRDTVGGRAWTFASQPAPIRLEAENLFDQLGFTKEESVAFHSNHKGDWTAVVAELKAESERRNKAESGE